MSLAQRVRSSSSTEGVNSFRRKMASSSLKMPRMRKTRKKKKIQRNKEEDTEEEILASSSLPINIDATGDYLHFIEDLERHPEHSPLRNSQAPVPDLPEEASDRQSDGHNASSYDLSGVWQAPSTGLSS
ncbi:hypothetical protein PIB30_087915 [Stylosanthes scabra]|uniref:Uncharacterized protein n=1 Tax=Stylosanthes scabra TaxID=79078 RepID=A0ABU6WUU6_9FABA|nr:hypothetical protein [Stylosanthes scabra]